MIKACIKGKRSSNMEYGNQYGDECRDQYGDTLTVVFIDNKIYNILRSIYFILRT